MTASNAKTRILQKLRDARTPLDTNTDPAPVYHWARIASPIEQFEVLLTANHAVVFNISETEIEQQIRSIVQERGFRCVLASDRVREQHPNLKQITDALPEGNIEAWKEFLFNDVEVGITSAICAIATTGTIVMRPGPDEPRSLSLVPPCHIVIVREETLFNDFAEVIHTQSWKNNMPTNMVLVSGPSKTADIQQTLAYGAHGPRELFVLFIRK